MMAMKAGLADIYCDLRGAIPGPRLTCCHHPDLGKEVKSQTTSCKYNIRDQQNQSDLSILRSLFAGSITFFSKHREMENVAV